MPEDDRQLRQQRDMAEHYLNVSGAIILSLDLSGRVCLLNHTAQRLLGYDEGEIIGQNWFDVAVPKEHRAAARQEFAALIDDGVAREIHYENEVLSKTGAHLYVRWNGTVVHNDAGEVVSVLASGIDLTEHKRTQDALRESTARLRDFTDAASDWLWETDADLKFTYVSSGLGRILGTPIDAMIGKTRAEFISTAEKKLAFNEKWDAHWDDLKNHRPFRGFEYQRIKADGSTLYVRANGKPVLDDAGNFMGYRGTGRDITAEVEARESASRAQNLLIHTLDYVPTMMVLFDAKERFVLCNKAYREALDMIADVLVPGITFEEISRISAQRGLAGEYRDDPEAWVRVRMARFRNPGDPVVHRQQDGRWVMTTDHGIPGGGTLIMRTDITPLKNAEEDLRAKEATLLAFLDAMRDPAAMVDLDANFILTNRAMAEQYGAEPQDLVGTAMFKVPQSGVGKQRRAWIDAVAESGKALRETDHFEGRWSDISITPVFDEQGTAAQIAVVARDITDDVNKDSVLRKMSRATEQSADLVVITDVQGKIEYVNRKFTETTGYTSEEVIGHNPSMLSSGDTPRAVYKQLWATVLSGETWRGDLKDRCKDGTLFWSAVTIAPIHDGNNDIVNFVSSHVDISERKAAEEAMREAMLRTEIANRAKSELLANMSHELRTPLNAIIGFSSMMDERVYGPIENPQYEEYTKIINSSACHLLDIINDILDVSAIEAGKLTLQEETFSVLDVVSSTLALMEHRATAGSVHVTSRVEPQDACLFGDARRVKQILLNLVSNAVKFTPENGTVEVDYTIDDEGRPVVCVSDSGIGMSAEEIEVALTQFGQADSGHARKYEGTGLGLPLTQGLVEMHGGEMLVQSTADEGTRVVVTLPKDRDVT